MKLQGVTVGVAVFGLCIALPLQAQSGSEPPTSAFPEGDEPTRAEGEETPPGEAEATPSGDEAKAGKGGAAASEEPEREAPAPATTEEEYERFTNDADDVDYASAAVDESAEKGARRGSWYIGFDVGGGWASTTFGAGDALDWSDIFDGTDSTRVALAFEVGATLGRKWLLGGRIAAIRETASEGGVSVSLQHNQYLVNLTGFPLESGEGLFLRAGGGLSILVLETTFGDDNVSGLGLAAGAGYAFWLGDSFNLTLSYDFNASLFEGDEDLEPTSGTFQTLQLGFYWY